MDPFTHGMVGMAIGVLSQGGVSLTNGILAACTLGAIAPDLDIIAQCWGDLAYLKQHRVISHSIPGILSISLIVAGVLKPFYPLNNYSDLFYWSFLGAFSHSILDFLNSYGVRILWPFSKKMWTANLLTLVDPVLITASLLIAFGKNWEAKGIFAFLFLVFYPLLRWAFRCQAKRIIENCLGHLSEEVKIIVLPSRCRFFKWDFIVKHSDWHLVGSLDLFWKKLQIYCKLEKIKEEMKEIFLRSPLGRVFQEFTPFFHILYEVRNNKIIARFMDLRYYARNRFLHNGLLIMDLDFKVEKAVFQPYAPSRRTYLAN
jgi:inner membrane protein